MDPFKGRRIVIATQHGKEAVIAPVVKKWLKLEPFLVQGLDTDLLGTFSGEVARKGGPLPAARRKCRMAMDVSGADLAISSEGSFGAHPEIPFIPANEEIAVLMDARMGLEIKGRKLSLHTNFNAGKVTTLAELQRFARSAKFPSHGLILKNSEQKASKMVKGITQMKELKQAFRDLNSCGEDVYVETDMRAWLNPSRMNVIREAVEDLVKNALNLCPKCKTPGFAPVSVERGLMCGLCGLPTRGIRFYVLSCQKCGFEDKRPVAEKFEDPQYCDHCNP